MDITANDHENYDGMTEDEIANYKWCSLISIFFDDYSGSLSVCNPSYTNQIIPNGFFIPDEGSKVISVNVNLISMETTINFSEEYWNREEHSTIKQQISEAFQRHIPKTKEVFTTSNSFKDNVKPIKDNLFFFQGSIMETNVANFHCKLHLLTLFFIDGASFIEYDDPRWRVFYLFKKNAMDDLFIIGFCTLYHFWYFPDKYRVRISQFVIFPPYQNCCYGTIFLDTILNYYRSNEMCYDITVEDPNEIFSTLIDSIDIYRLQQLNNYTPSIKCASVIQKCLYNDALKNLKITKKRFIILCEMLALYACDNDNDLAHWSENLKNRLKRPLQIQIERAKSVKLNYCQDIKIEIIEQLGKELMMIPEAIDIARENYSNTLLRSSKLYHVLSVL